MCPDLKNLHLTAEDLDFNDDLASIIEVRGKVKWFDPSKGYGFITPDNGMGDIIVYAACLNRHGITTIYEGSRILCEALLRPKGLVCFRVLSVDQSTATHPSQKPPARTHTTVSPAGDLVLATVKWFNRERGFGFLTRGKDTQDIFVHMEIMRRYGFTHLRPGQTLLVRYGPGQKGLMAAEIWPQDKVWFDDAPSGCLPIVNDGSATLEDESEGIGNCSELSSARLNNLFQGDTGLSKSQTDSLEASAVDEAENRLAFPGSYRMDEDPEICASRIAALFLGKPLPERTALEKVNVSSIGKAAGKSYH
jgi:cold shock protein